MIAADIFRAYDIRGIVGDTLTEQAAYWLGRAFAAELIEQGQTATHLAWDGRLSSPLLAEHFQQGVLEAGIDVVVLGAQPTGVLYFSTHHHSCPNGMMITGSHNPAEYNGFKPVIHRQSLYGDEIQRLYNRIVHDDLPCLPQAGQRFSYAIAAEYVAKILDCVQLARPLKVVVDAGNGIAGPLAMQLIEALGLPATFLYCDVDGHFPHHHPDPGIPENLAALRRTVLAQQADVGLAFDGDGDRVALVDDRANIIWPDRLLMLLCRDILPKHPNATVIYDVKSSGELPKWVRQHGGHPVMTATGHSLMKREMHARDALIGGEFSGHLYLGTPWYGFDDGLYAAMRLLDVLSRSPLSSSEVFAALPEEHSTPEMTINVREDNKFALIECLKTDAELLDGGELYEIDGLRIEFLDGWGLVRASNTTPKLTLRFAAQTPDALIRIQQKFEQALARLPLE